MPNWCSNTINITGPKEDINKFVEHLDSTSGKDWFSYFKPMPEEFKEEWYAWNQNNWGCKWNCDAQDWNLQEDGDNATVFFWFDSPWGPPINLYETINANYEIEASYYEPGMAFVGEFREGYDSEYQCATLDDLDYIPANLEEEWNLREQLENMEEEWDPEEELDKITVSEDEE